MKGPPEKYYPKTTEQILGYLAEECGEVVAAVGKSLRWGLNSSNPELPEEEQETNRDWLIRELDDLEVGIHIARCMLGPGKCKTCDNTGRVPDNNDFLNCLDCRPRPAPEPGALYLLRYLRYLEIPARAALESEPKLHEAGTPTGNVTVTWHTSYDTLHELLAMIGKAPP
jgi:hypothetical protein